MNTLVLTWSNPCWLSCQPSLHILWGREARVRVQLWLTRWALTSCDARGEGRGNIGGDETSTRDVVMHGS